ncbi:MAG: phosphoribosylglycinamide formyltransferase [Planctomycetes bacterium]|nr:phosphoribosylglycinamide formyltransferase [Planctomycetota bacterium]
MSPHPLAVLVSGSGRHLENLAALCASGELDAELALLICDRAGVGALERAERLGLPLLHLDPERRLTPEAFAEEAFAAMRARGVQTVVLAGFLRFLVVPPDFRGRVLNIHPSLLPAFGGKGFYGHRVHQAVLDRGCQVSGCTVHLVDEVFDNGPILLQRWCPVEPGDDADRLAQRVFELELEAYPAALRGFLAGA